MDDDKIVELYLSRDENAISQTANKYGSRLRNIANNILNDRETAKECENDTYLKAWNLIPPNEPREYLFAFMGRIARHIALDRCKNDNRQKRHAIYCELTQEMQECIPSESNPESDVEAQYLSDLIDGFLGTCTREQRSVFVRRYWYFETIPVICKRYGFSQSKVKMMLLRMREQLKEYLIKGGYDL